MQGIPIHYDGEQLKTALLSLLDLSETLGFIKVRSLSTCLAANRQHRVATVSFKETPRGLREGREWPFELLDTETSTSSYQIVIDSHFKGLTPLGFLENESKQAIEQVFPNADITLLTDLKLHCDSWTGRTCVWIF